MALENTNKAIAVNSLILYVKMVITTICALLTTRFALQALGVADFGLYAVLGGIIGFISIFNTIMLSTSNRFIAVAIGRGNVDEANKQFNVNLVIHIVIALLVLLIAYPVGDWYIPRYVNYEGPLSNAMMVYLISIAGCVVSFIGVPYNGLLMAKEKFIVFSAMDVFSHIAKLIVAWLIVYHFEQKLLIYTVTMASLTGLPTLLYIGYCNMHYRDVVKLRLVREKQMYKSVFSFSAWVGVGAVAAVGKNQGAALVVNAFFNTVMNTAMGVASSINAYVALFAQNITQPMAPQITKSYASGDLKRTEELLIMSTKYSYLLTLMIGSFFLSEPEWLISIWLGKVPPYASIFLTLFVIDNLVHSLNSGIGNLIFASGRVSLYQICSSSLNILSVVFGYFVLRGGAPAYFLTVCYIIVSVVRFVVLQWVLNHTLHYDSRSLWQKSYIPSLITTALFIPSLFMPIIKHPSVNLLITFAYICILEWFVGLSSDERVRLTSFVKSKISRITE